MLSREHLLAEQGGGETTSSEKRPRPVGVWVGDKRPWLGINTRVPGPQPGNQSRP